MEEQKFNLMKIAGKLKKYLDEDRLWHTLGVMQMSASLAIRYDYPMERAQLAGLLHDCAKCIPAKIIRFRSQTLRESIPFYSMPK